MKSLSALCLAASLAFNSFSQDAVLKYELPTKQQITIESKVSSKEALDESRPNAFTDMVLTLKDNETTVIITDDGKDGIGPNDSLCLYHRFKGGEHLYVCVKYQKEKQYSVDCSIVYVGFPQLQKTIKSSELNPVIKFLVDKKAKPILEWGESTYTNILNAVTIQRAPQLPYLQIKAALNELEKALPAIRAEKKDAMDALKELAKQYYKQIQKKEI